MTKDHKSNPFTAPVQATEQASTPLRERLSAAVDKEPWISRVGAWIHSNWVPISAAGAIVAFLVSTYLTWLSLSDTLKMTRQIAEVNLARDLSREFDGTAKFEEIRRGIVNCSLGEGEEPGLVATGDLSRYLNFLDDVGLYYRLGAIDFELVDHLFGSLIIETYQYPGLQERIAGVESKGKESGANKELLALGKELTLLYPEQAEYWRIKCYTHNDTSTGG